MSVISTRVSSLRMMLSILHLGVVILFGVARIGSRGVGRDENVIHGASLEGHVEPDLGPNNTGTRHAFDSSVTFVRDRKDFHLGLSCTVLNRRQSTKMVVSGEHAQRLHLHPSTNLSTKTLQNQNNNEILIQ